MVKKNYNEKIRNKIFNKFEKSKNYNAINGHCNWIHFNDIDDIIYAQSVFDSYGIAYKKFATIPGDKRKNWIRLSIGPGLSEMEFIEKFI